MPKRYRSFRTGEFTPADIDRWIETAATYVGAEKAFVDDLIAANPNVIDLEMGLPAQTGSRSAPRMDLVVVQPDASIAFWEAKFSGNGELRSKVGTPYAERANGEYVSGIHVVSQLRNYQRWMEVDGGKRQSEVVSGYVRTATILGELAHKFGKEDAAALEAWSNVSSTACLILPPGVVVGNYCPAGYPSQADKDTDRFERLARSYSRYRCELEAHGARVQEVPRNGDALFLPVLGNGHISDKPNQRARRACHTPIIELLSEVLAQRGDNDLVSNEPVTTMPPTEISVAPEGAWTLSTFEPEESQKLPPDQPIIDRARELQNLLASHVAVPLLPLLEIDAAILSSVSADDAISIGSAERVADARYNLDQILAATPRAGWLAANVASRRPGKVDATNNVSERALRPSVIQRKVTNGYRAKWAADAEADLRTTVDTARLSGANPFNTILGAVSA